MNFDRFIAIFAILLTAVTIIVGIYPAELNKALGHAYPITVTGYNIVIISIIVIVLQLLILLSFALILRREAHKAHVLSLQVDAFENELRRFRDNTLVDVVTGIPNQSKLQEDVVRIASKITDKDQYQVIMLDFDRFGEINNKFGYRKGDLVIKAIAQGIYNSMRRDEEAYKRPFAGSVAADDLWRRIYRKYSGGDEFIFLIRGTEDEALGFLLRVQRRFDSEFGKQVQAILGEPWKLSFHAGLCRLNPGDKFETMLGRVEECLRLARQKGSEARVFWASGKTNADFPDNSFAARTYTDAQKLFAL
jgi:diguanylate cyclase (GGDEF)-like protein